MTIRSDITEAKQECVLTRMIIAPREIAFKAWTDPMHVSQWWGPYGFTNPICEMHVKPGGVIRINMRGPDRVIYPMIGVFKEIAKPERLVFTSSALDDTGNPIFENLNTVVFEKQNGKTELKLHACVISKTANA